MLPIKNLKPAVTCAQRLISTHANQETTAKVAKNWFTSNPLALASICTLGGLSIGALCTGNKEQSIVSSAKEVLGLYLQKMGKSLQESPNPSLTDKIAPKEAEIPKALEPAKPSQNLLTTLSSSPAAQTVCLGLTGTLFTFLGSSLAPISFGLMGFKILETSGIYDYLKKQVFAATHLADDPTKAKKA